MDKKYIMAEKIDFEINNFGDFVYIGNNEGIEYINISDYIKSKKAEKLYMFVKNNKIKGIKNSSKEIKDLSHAFSNLKIESLNLSEFNTENVISFYGMFKLFKCEELDISNFRTENCLFFNNMFAFSTINKIDISHFKFNKNCSFIDMFYIKERKAHYFSGGMDSSILNSYSLKNS